MKQWYAFFFALWLSLPLGAQQWGNWNWNWNWNGSQQQDPFAASSLRIVGDFEGWQGNTVVELSDGTFWIQREYTYDYCYQFNPRVILRNGKMWVEGCNEDRGVGVAQLIGAERLSVVNIVDNNGTKVLVLSDGSAWTSPWAPIWDFWIGEECILFQNGGWKCLIDDEIVDLVPAQLPQRSMQQSGGYIQYGTPPSSFFPRFPSAPAETILQLVNDTDWLLYACVISFSSAEGWVSRGWYKLDPHQSIQLSLGWYKGTVYLYAEDSQHQYFWYDANLPYRFCVHRVNAFAIPHSDVLPCTGSDYKKVQASAFQVQPGINIWRFQP